MHGYSYEYVELWNTFSRETRGYPTELWPHSAASPKRGGAFHRNRPPHFRTTPNLTSDTSVQKRGRNYECAGLIRGGARFVAASNKKKKKEKTGFPPIQPPPCRRHDLFPPSTSLPCRHNAAPIFDALILYPPIPRIKIWTNVIHSSWFFLRILKFEV